MPARQCVCGASIPMNWSLCGECREIYGTNRAQWPEWLRWLVADLQREIDYDRYHYELEYFDERNNDKPETGNQKNWEYIDGFCYVDIDRNIDRERKFSNRLAAMSGRQTERPKKPALSEEAVRVQAKYEQEQAELTALAKKILKDIGIDSEG